MGANLKAGGATFRVWAPQALAVHAGGEFNGWAHDDSSLLTPAARGHWWGFIPGVREGQRYKFYVVGEGSEGWKRDPYARELTKPFPGDCLVRSSAFPWHETGYSPPRFEDLVIYQLHAGTFHAPAWPRRAGTFLDVAGKIDHFLALGVTALQLMPVVEFPTQFSLGYNGTDYFSPEMDFGIEGDAELRPHLDRVNALLARKGLAPYALADIRGCDRQLKALIDLCHVHGIAVILDVVYNHAGGDFGDESLYFFDRQRGQHQEHPDLNNSLYFIDRGHAGGLVFAFWKEEVRQFLIDNACFFLDEYRVDGFRYDQVSVIVAESAADGWRFCQDLTDTVRSRRPQAVDKAEYWPVDPYIVRPRSEGGAGFDTSLTDGLRNAIRRAVAQSSAGGAGPVDMTAVAASLWPGGFARSWQTVEGPENHDLVYRGRGERLPRLADPSNARSWYARSRSRVATGMCLTAPGIPMLFMGQEFLEDKQWADDLEHHADLLLHWEGALGADRAMTDHLRFTSDLIALRRREPALRGEGFRAVHVHDQDRVLAFHRWVPGEGRDVLVVASLAEETRHGYEIGFPSAGAWREAFNSDCYDHFPNPWCAGNGGRVHADRPGRHGCAQSAALVLPANALLVFTRDGG
jgi:1,4-alpha-glucan branching enzyme